MPSRGLYVLHVVRNGLQVKRNGYRVREGPERLKGDRVQCCVLGVICWC